MASAKGIIGRFEVFAAARFKHAPKPSPAGILDALATLSVVPDSDVLYVGDQAIDAIAAERAGISFVWARYGYGQLQGEPRIAEIAALSELLDL
jgi:phosphoglycolate phosphatase